MKKHQFDLMNFLPALEYFFGFNKKLQSHFSEEANMMANWDNFLGPRWDIIGREQDILIFSMTFCKLRFSSGSPMFKIKVHLGAVTKTIFGTDYRMDAKTAMGIQHQPVGCLVRLLFF